MLTLNTMFAAKVSYSLNLDTSVPTKTTFASRLMWGAISCFGMGLGGVGKLHGMLKPGFGGGLAVMEGAEAGGAGWGWMGGVAM